MRLEYRLYNLGVRVLLVGYIGLAVPIWVLLSFPEARLAMARCSLAPYVIVLQGGRLLGASNLSPALWGKDRLRADSGKGLGGKRCGISTRGRGRAGPEANLVVSDKWSNSPAIRSGEHTPRTSRTGTTLIRWLVLGAIGGSTLGNIY